ncbi:hypothetical protein KTGMC3_P2041 [Methanocalculus sp. MC3]
MPCSNGCHRYFNPRAHGGHDNENGHTEIPENFNPRAHGGHDDLAGSRIKISRISIHVPTGGTTLTGLIGLVDEISIHVPTGGTTRCQDFMEASIKISIHVPTGGTTWSEYRRVRIGKFQSTCPRGARLLLSRSYDRDIDFNPRAHGGHDVPPKPRKDAWAISIHVPTGGTTRRNQNQHPPRNFNPRAHGGHDGRSVNTTDRRNFNPRAHGGHDRHDQITTEPHEFQSTCPRGARPIRPEKGCRTTNFNPRAHGGHDKIENSIDNNRLFQSTCPRGARLVDSDDLVVGAISIHVPTGGTTSPNLSLVCVDNFNPRAHGGHDLPNRDLHLRSTFQSTCPRGARRGLQSHQLPAQSFQSTCPRGARPTSWTPPSGIDISIHVPTGGTTILSLMIGRNKHFNPRAHGGHDDLSRVKW